MGSGQLKTDLHGYFIEDLIEGMSASYAKTITEADIVIFAGISGDNNPLHLNEEFAKEFANSNSSNASIGQDEEQNKVRQQEGNEDGYVLGIKL